MGEAIITRRAGGSSSSNLIVALWWAYWSAGTDTQYSSAAYSVVAPVDSDFFTFDVETQNLIASKAMNVNIMPIVRGGRTGSGGEKNVTYKIYKNGTQIMTQSGINVAAATLADTPTAVSLAVGDILTMSVTTNASGTAATEAGYFIELQ